METGLAGRTVIVTGGNANIGRGIALAFAAESTNVVSVARDEAQGLRVCEQLLERGAKEALWHAADLTDRAQVDTMVGAVHERFGCVDVLVNNVGGNVDFDLFVDSDPATWDQDIALNMTTTLHCTQAVLPGMIQRASGRIINIGSTSGFHPDGIISRSAATRADEMAVIARRTVLERQTAFPSEIGAAAVYLASDAAAFVTGQVLAVDGGTQIA